MLKKYHSPAGQQAGTLIAETFVSHNFSPQVRFGDVEAQVQPRDDVPNDYRVQRGQNQQRDPRPVQVQDIDPLEYQANRE